MYNDYSTDYMRDKLAGKYFVFIGQNASTGTPHTTTGHYNFYGTYYAADSKEQAQEFIDNRVCYNSFEAIEKAGTINTLRKYSLGNTWLQYLEHLAGCPHVDEVST